MLSLLYVQVDGLDFLRSMATKGGILELKASQKISHCTHMEFS